MRIGRGWSRPPKTQGGGSSDPSWSRYLLNSGTTKTDPGGGATVTVNAESGGGWTDISQSAQNEKQPVNLTNWSLGLTKSDGSTPITFSDLFIIQAQIVVNQFTDTTGSRTGAGQTPCVYVSNASVPSTSAHYYYGEGLGYTSNGTNIKIARVYATNAANAPGFTTQQIKNSSWSNNYRVNLTISNTVQRGPYLALAEYRQFNNTALQTGWDDIEGLNHGSGQTAVYFGASDQVYLNLYFPGLNSSSSNFDLTNMQFKLYYNVTVLNQDATA